MMPDKKAAVASLTAEHGLWAHVVSRPLCSLCLINDERNANKSIPNHKQPQKQSLSPKFILFQSNCVFVSVTQHI